MSKVEGWQVEKLGDVSEVFADGDWIESKNQSSSGIRLIQTGNVGNGFFKNRKNKARYISQKTFKELRCTEIFEGDCLVSRLPDPVGRACILPDTGERMITAVDCTIIRFDKEKILPEFFNYYALSLDYLSLVDRETTGTTRKRISRKNLGKIPVPVPPIPEQKRIVALLDEAFDALDQVRANAERNLVNARDVFDSALQEILDNSSSHWEQKSLGDERLLQIIDGDRGKNYPRKKDFLDEGFCLFMNTKNVRPDGFKFEETMFITQEKDEALRKGKLKRNDVVMTTRGTIGNLGVYTDEVEYEHVRINSGMLIFRPNLSVITPEFLFEVFRSEIMKAQIRKHVSGAAQPQLPIKTLVNFTIPVPNTIAEQKAIVKKLKTISEETKELEAVYERKVAVVDELKKSLLQRAFAGEL